MIERCKNSELLTIVIFIIELTTICSQYMASFVVIMRKSCLLSLLICSVCTTLEFDLLSYYSFLELVSNLCLKTYDSENIVLCNKNVCVWSLNYEHVLASLQSKFRNTVTSNCSLATTHQSIWPCAWRSINTHHGRFKNAVTVTASAVLR